LIWGWAAYNFEMQPGMHEFSYKFPMLPLRPGPYAWLVSLYDDQEEIDVWECVPEMIVATETRQHTYDHWNGVLNIPSEFFVLPKAEAGTESSETLDAASKAHES